MLSRFRPSPAMVVACVALIVALGGTAYAVTSLPNNSVGTKQLKSKAVTAQKIKDGAVTGAKVKLSTLGTVRNASDLGGSPASAYVKGRAEGWHLVGQTVGEPQFGSNWTNNGSTTPVRFYKDQIGIVHLGGDAVSSPGSTTIFTLPAGYRPQYELNMPAVGCGIGYVAVEPTGEVGAGQSGYACSLDGLSFRGG